MDVVRTDQRCRTFAAALVAAAFVVLAGAAVAARRAGGHDAGARATSCLRATGARTSGADRPGARRLLPDGAPGRRRERAGRDARRADGLRERRRRRGRPMAAAGPVRVKGADAVAAAVRDAGAPFARPVVVGRGQARAVVAAAAPTGDAAVVRLRPRRSRAGPLDDPFAPPPPGAADGRHAPAGRHVRRAACGVGLVGRGLPAARRAGRGVRRAGHADDRLDAAAASAGHARSWDRRAGRHRRGGGPGRWRGGPIKRLARDRQDVTRIALDVAASGGALLAFGSSGGLDAFERGVPGGTFASIGPIVGQPDGDDLYLDLGEPAVALADDGGAAMIAWRESGASPTAGAGADLVMARTRTVAGPFAASTVVDGRPRTRRTDLQSGGSSATSPATCRRPTTRPTGCAPRRATGASCWSRSPPSRRRAAPPWRRWSCRAGPRSSARSAARAETPPASRRCSAPPATASPPRSPMPRRTRPTTTARPAGAARPRRRRAGRPTRHRARAARHGQDHQQDAAPALRAEAEAAAPATVTATSASRCRWRCAADS